LLSDLNIGNPGDGLTVVSAMRRTQPEAVTMILTGYPAFETALEAIRQQVDDYIVKPASIPVLVNTIESKLATPPRQRQLPPPKRVAMLLQEHIERIEDLWLASIEDDKALSQVLLSSERRLDHLHGVLAELIPAGQSYSGEKSFEHNGVDGGPEAAGRDFEGYTPSMMLGEFCRLRRIIAQIIQENLLAVNLSYVIPDLAQINECLDDHAQAALASLSKRGDRDAARG
jgi:CheY-like chemotaxis protein